MWSIYYLAYARRKFGHGAEWRSQEDAVAAETAEGPAPGAVTGDPLPDPPA